MKRQVFIQKKINSLEEYVKALYSLTRDSSQETLDSPLLNLKNSSEYDFCDLYSIAEQSQESVID
ncbi:MAG: hypothetical protein SFT68_01530 [Rickettsiaceae bacterium]|nr:hypothetical protein [Rickettsiaceae bacterium]